MIDGTDTETRRTAEGALERSQGDPTVAPAAVGIPHDPPEAAAPMESSTPARYAPVPRVTECRRRTVLAEPGLRTVQLVWLLLIVAECFVGLRVIFAAVVANRSAGFVRFIDAVSGWLVAPFHPIVSDARLRNGGVLETGSLIGMAIFLVAALVLIRLVRIVTDRRVPTSAVPA